MIFHVGFPHNVSLALDREEWGPKIKRNITIMTTCMFWVLLFHFLRIKLKKKRCRIGRDTRRRFFLFGGEEIPGTG